MRLLLDTHVFFWATMACSKLSNTALDRLQYDTNQLFVSVASAWEIAIKVGNGKWPEAEGLLRNLEAIVDASGIEVQTISVVHVRAAGLLGSSHRDPFDLLLAAQAVAENMTLVSADSVMASLGATVLW